MSINRWNPINAMQSFSEGWVERIGNSARTKPFSTVFATFEELLQNSSIVEMTTENDKINYHIDLPGVKKDGLSVCQDGNVIRVRGERKDRVDSVVEAQFTIAKMCDVESLQADLCDGVLTVSFLKRKEDKSESKRIEVKVKNK